MRAIATLALLLSALFFLAACEPEIGDECSSSVDCPTGSLCDTSSPDGYCLITWCEANDDCPVEAVCVEFDDFTHYCLKKCSGSDDCRDGYACRDDVGTDSFCYVPASEDAEPYERAE